MNCVEGEEKEKTQGENRVSINDGLAQAKKKGQEIYLAGFDIWSVSTSSFLSKDKLGWVALEVSVSHERCCDRALSQRERQEIKKKKRHMCCEFCGDG